MNKTNRQFKSFINSLKKSKGIYLTENEKNWTKERLIHFMEKTPVRDVEFARQQIMSRPIDKFIKKFFEQFNALKLTQPKKTMTALIIISLIFSLGGGTSFAANDALPGEALYPVKININEKIESAFALSQESKAEFNLEKAELRLQETEALTSKNKIEANLIDQLDARFEKHTNKTEQLAEKFERQGKDAKAAQLRARLGAMLEIHSQILEDLQQKLNELPETEGAEKVEIEIENKEKLDNFISKIKIKATFNSSAETDDDDDDDEEDNEEAAEEDENEDKDEDDEDEDKQKISQSSAVNAKNLAEKSLAQALSFADKKQNKVGSEVSEKALEYLSKAQEFIDEGNEYLENEQYNEAFSSFHKAHKYIQKSQSYIAAGARLEWKINIDIDDYDNDRDEKEQESDDNDDDSENEKEDEEDNNKNEDEDEDEDDEDEDEDEDDENEDEDEDDEKEDEDEDDDDNLNVQINTKARLETRLSL